jgi:hypothetical protein
MVKRRKLTTVIITAEQRERLERLWFYYGNYGPKTTSGNHSFIQRLLEQGIDERSLHTKRTPKSALPTPECVAAVEVILRMKSDSSSSRGQDTATGLRLISSREKQRPKGDPEMQAVCHDMKPRSGIVHMCLEEGDHTLDAA